MQSSQCATQLYTITPKSIHKRESYGAKIKCGWTELIKGQTLQNYKHPPYGMIMDTGSKG